MLPHMYVHSLIQHMPMFDLLPPTSLLSYSCIRLHLRSHEFLPLFNFTCRQSHKCCICSQPLGLFVVLVLSRALFSPFAVCLENLCIVISFAFLLRYTVVCSGVLDRLVLQEQLTGCLLSISLI